MKVKQQPEDFQVEELTDLAPDRGDYALYQLEKVGWTTPDALLAVRRRWRIDAERLSCGGLKDRHAQTSQFFTIHHGPRRGLRQQHLEVRYLGQVEQPYTSTHIRANRFVLTIRELADEGWPAIAQALDEVGREGVPNYYDDQRFGSVISGGECMARALVQRRFEDALKLALIAPYEHDRADDKQIKAILRKHWGDWRTCRDLLPRSPARALIEHLCFHPDDHKVALGRLHPELRGLYLSAYQSHLWNQILARWLEQHCRPEQLRPLALKLGPLPAHVNLEPEQQQALARLQVPLPSARLHLEEGDPLRPLVEGVLTAEGLQLRDMQVKGVRSLFFSKGERAALCLPAKLEHERAADERHPGQQKLTLRFELLRGAYATLIVKRVID